MLNAKTIKNHLKLKDIYRLMQHLKASPHDPKDGIIQSQTVCHGGDSHKLYYYDNNHTFHCYTNCGSFDVFELIQKVKQLEFKQAFQWIKSFFGFSSKDYQPQTKSTIVDPVIELKKQLQPTEIKKLKAIDPKILNDFDDMAYIDWIKQGITPDTLAKFKIKLDLFNEEIIIPEFDENNRLIGIRCRHLDQQSLDQGKKYTPINYKGEELNYPTGRILYGMNFNRDVINHYHKVVLFEAEKSVLKLDSAIGNKNIALGLNGSNLTEQHLALLNDMNIDEVMVALDKEYKHPYTKAERIYAEQIESQFYPLKKYFNISIVWDQHDDLNYKDSPIDQGFKTFKKLVKERIFL